MRRIGFTVALALCVLFVPALAQHAQGPHFIFLVRHAEKVSSAPDALLSEQGLKRAQCLGQTLRDAKIGEIYTTEVVRTQQTAAPLAKLLGFRPIVIPRAKTDELIKRLQATHAENTLVVDHSDLLPKIIASIGGGKVGIGDKDYDLLFVIARDNAGKTSLTTLHYCELK